MRQRPYDEGRVLRYLAWTFGIAYVLQAGVGALAAAGDDVGSRVAISAMMFIPAVGALLCDVRPADLGMRPRLRENGRYFALAWFGPLALAIAGALLYFLVFPAHLDLTGAFLRQMAGPEALDQLAEAGLSVPLLALVNAVAAVTYAPLINTVLAFGEEVGWRAFLYPQLKQRYGRVGGIVLGGIVWGMWHWPLIGAIGYEYGVDYAGFPLTGMAIFCVFTIACGAVCDWLYERTRTIWAPSVFHGAMNAAASLPLLLCAVDTGTARLAGPAPNGLVAGPPFAALAVALVVRGKRPSTEGERDRARG